MGTLESLACHDGFSKRGTAQLRVVPMKKCTQTKAEEVIRDYST